MTATIESLAREAFGGMPDGTEADAAWWAAHAGPLTRFAALVRRQALEDAVAACIQTYPELIGGEIVYLACNAGVDDCAAAIRALADKP